MDIKSVKKIKLPKNIVENVAENYVKTRIEELVPNYYGQLVKKLESDREDSRYLYLKNKNVYYDFETGTLFPNFYTKEIIEDNVFSGYQGREMDIEEEGRFRKVFPREDSRKIYVDCQVEESGDGSSWEQAMKTVGEAIAIAVENDDIIVAEGNYLSITITQNGIGIHGGYRSGEKNLFLAPVGESVFSDIYLRGNSSTTLAYLVTGLNINTSQNFRCCGIRARGLNKDTYGDIAKIYIYNSNGNFYNSVIENNRVVYNNSNTIRGGGVFISNSITNFINCIFINNSVTNSYDGTYSRYANGGAIFTTGSSDLNIVDCTFSGNTGYRRYSSDIFIENSSVYVVGASLNYHQGSNSPSYIKYENLDINLRNEIEELDSCFPIYDLVKKPKNNNQVFNTLVCEDLLDLSEVKGQNVFLKENFTLKDGFLVGSIIEKLYKNIFDLNIDGEILTKKSIYDRFSTGELKIDREYIYDIFLNGDKRKIDITSYDKKMLEDITRGHWDLWEDNYGGELEIELNDEIVARNPKLDINYNGIVAIDFGTKSTVVAYQKDDDTTYIKRIGAGNLAEDIKGRDYENPTVLEFRNLEKFLKDYKARDGRPDTEWEDLTSSYTANSRLFDGESDEFFTVFPDLKQWAGINKRKKIKDKQGNSWDLALFSELDLENDINPIEIYAYHIGTAINNMHGDGIFIDYVLSFPVKYEDDLCKKICSSFERGLKKSLPKSILEDEEIMSKFKVRVGASEPAAYAVCALQEYGFEPEGEEEVVYGVFDFGGGTTDFDFGVWREPKKGSYDFEIEHFYDNGDKYLGGENILQLLAFEIFKAENNQDTLRENGVTFILPPECVAYPGSETLIANSQEAELNTRKMMEKCRYFWEHNGENFVSEEESDKFAGGTLTIELYSKDGEPKSCELNVDLDRLREVISTRIDKGVRNFFESWKVAIKDLKKFEKFYIFLAGNSSKSAFLSESFKRYLDNISLEVEDRNIKDIFEIFPPLGTDEAKAIQEERGGSLYEEIIAPTGKTGVAYGLIRSRESGKIKVIKKKSNQFKYFIGFERRRKFNLVISRDVELNQWKEFTTADRGEFELFYTELPEVLSGELSIKNIKKMVCNIDEIDEDKSVFIRAISNTTIEYTVATSEELAKEDYSGKIYQKELE